MALLTDDLSVHEIAFRWAGYDPNKFWFRTPLIVKDNFRTLMFAILKGHLECSTLSLDKWDPRENDAFEKQFFIRTFIDEIYAGIAGHNFGRKLLEHAMISRPAMQLWCERLGIPLPEFWFPPGWKIEYEWPNTDEEQPVPENIAETKEEVRQRIDKRHRIQMACQQMAIMIWMKERTLTIKEVAIRKEIQEIADCGPYQLETVQEWIREFDPRDPSQKRGRKRKNNSPPGAPESP